MAVTNDSARSSGSCCRRKGILLFHPSHLRPLNKTILLPTGQRLRSQTDLCYGSVAQGWETSA